MVGRILGAARGTAIEGPVTIGAATGLRLGEILGLTWAAVELPSDGGRGVLRLSQAVQWTSDGWSVVGPKSGHGRSVALAPSLAGWLQRHRTAQSERFLALGQHVDVDEFVLDNGPGRPRRTDAVTRGFSDLLKASGLPHCRFHDLRHAYATTNLRAGVHPKVVSEALGHSSVLLTLDTYSHVLPDMQDRAAEAIEAALGAAITGS